MPTLSIDSLYALTVCALLRLSRLEVYMGRVIVAYGHPSGASRTAPWIRVETPPCRNYTRAWSRSYKYMRTSTIKRRHDAIANNAKCLKLILWAGSWIKIVHTKNIEKVLELEEMLELWKRCLPVNFDCLSVGSGWIFLQLCSLPFFGWLAIYQSCWSFECRSWIFQSL